MRHEMIRYSLKCTDGHGFESWFQSAEAYDKLQGAGLVACTMCGSTKVEKALMAPRVRPSRKAAAEPAAPAEVPTAPQQTTLSSPSSELEKAITALKQQVEANSDYVGKNFAKEARDMYLGESPQRAIHGEAKPEEARALIEEGVPVLPLPFLPNRKTN